MTSGYSSGHKTDNKDNSSYNSQQSTIHTNQPVSS